MSLLTTDPRNTTILITEPDRSRLQGTIDALLAHAYANRLLPTVLQGKLARARVVPPGAVPANVITMNTRFRLHHLERETDETYTLVFPPHSDPTEGRLSVIDPLGVAALGHRVGDTFEWPILGGGRRARVEEVLFQPEREGCFNL